MQLPGGRRVLRMVCSRGEVAALSDGSVFARACRARGFDPVGGHRGRTMVLRDNTRLHGAQFVS